MSEQPPGPASGPKTFRIFLASPGDVPYERQIAREVIDQVRSERRFRGRFDLQVIAWDQPGGGVAMEAGLTPQEAIARGLPKPDQCDLAVVILWSRIGTPLPPEYTRPGGQPYRSGTEWEVCNAIQGFRERGGPRVWVYRRTEVPKLDINDPEGDAKAAQWNALEAFLSELANPDGSIAGGLNTYPSPDAFRRRLEQHLRDHLDALLERSPPPAVAAEPPPPEPPRWRGVPYPGLEAFTPEQAPIFFGRGPEIDQLIGLLSDPQVRFVAVVGVSGSGKSSLVAAGLVPRLRQGAIDGAPWRDIAFKPGERGGDPFLALAYALKAALGTTGETEAELASDLRAGPGRFQRALDAILADAPTGSELLLLVDQFEELLAAGADPAPFLDWLAKVSELPRLRIAATLRADFYAQAVALPVLASLLRRDRGTFPLDPPGTAALHEMIAGPAQAAGLELDEGLAGRVLADAGSDPGALALVAFAMHELYERGRAAGRLALADYDAIGGVAGAVRRRAELALGRLGAAADRGLDTLFTHLVEVNEQEVATRRRAAKEGLAGEALLAALTDARLLVTGKGEDDRPTVEVAHEVLLTAWPRLAGWIERHAETLRARRDLERAAAEWEEAGRPGSALRTGPLYRRYLAAAEPRSGVAKAFLAACRRRVWQGRAGLGLAGLMLAAGMVLFWHAGQSQYGPWMATKGLLAQIGLWPVSEPDMVPIDPGAFQMGSTEGDGDERPVHTVTFAEPFEIGRYEVSFEAYDLFAAATGRAKPNDEGWGRGSRPVINVSWEDAVAYAGWLSGKTGKGYRLPSEAEWEYAARAGTRTPRFWHEAAGDDPDPACDHANVFDEDSRGEIEATYGRLQWELFDCDDGYAFTAPAGSFEPNPWGLYDALGNVWEWVHDCYRPSYEDAPGDGSVWEPADPEDCAARVVRGGSWSTGATGVRSAYRVRNAPASRTLDLGFRLARSY